ncbi:MAG: outer membrane beta-barrel domain-containing protein [Myxococcaceae bacterium]
MKANPLKAVLLAALTASSVAPAQDLIENVVVRNRLHDARGRIELGGQVGFSLLSRLTNHYNFTASLAWNMTNEFALELVGGYAASHHTGLADQITDDVSANNALTSLNDLSGLWEMNGNGALGLRWAPLYGKISLMAELPVHFQFYIWLGAGAGTFLRESVVDCDASRACAVDAKVAPLVSAAFGFRLFITDHVALKLEIRDYSYADSYREQIVRTAAPGTSGVDATNPGITNLVLINVGAHYLF